MFVIGYGISVLLVALAPCMPSVKYGIEQFVSLRAAFGTAGGHGHAGRDVAPTIRGPPEPKGAVNRAPAAQAGDRAAPMMTKEKR